MAITETWLRIMHDMAFSQRMIGVVIGRYTFEGRQAEPITNLVELMDQSDVDLLKRPGCGRKTLREFRKKLSNPTMHNNLKRALEKRRLARRKVR